MVHAHAKARWSWLYHIASSCRREFIGHPSAGLRLDRPDWCYQQPLPKSSYLCSHPESISTSDLPFCLFLFPPFFCNIKSSIRNQVVITITFFPSLIRLFSIPSRTFESLLYIWKHSGTFVCPFRVTTSFLFRDRTDYRSSRLWDCSRGVG